jgi:hypothetical protein
MKTPIFPCLAAGLVILSLCSGCRTKVISEGAWFSSEDLKQCQSFAMESFTNDHPLLPPESPGDPIINIGDWRIPTITVYIPIHTAASSQIAFVYYTFTNLGRQAVGSNPLSLARRMRQEFMVAEFGTVTPDGYRVPLVRRRGPPVLATPKTSSSGE